MSEKGTNRAFDIKSDFVVDFGRSEHTRKIVMQVHREVSPRDLLLWGSRNMLGVC